MMTEVEEATIESLKRQQDLKDKGIYFDALHIPYDRLTVRYNGQEIFMLNKRLLDQQNCWTNLEELKEVHWFRYCLTEMMQETDDILLLRDLAQDIIYCDFELQKLWRFDQDAKFHIFWELPQCACPKLDNQERYPTGHYVINCSCPVHGNIPLEPSGAI